MEAEHLNQYDVQVVIVSIVLLIIYFLPTINAYSKKHRNRALICLLNILLGWTLIGWLIAAAWSAGSAKDDPVVPSPKTHVRCPDCAEYIFKEAKVCKHCRCKLLPQ